MPEPHEVIYLQLYDEDSLVDGAGEPLHEGVTWCEDRINERDVKYVREDIYNLAFNAGRELFEKFNEEYGEGIKNGYWPRLAPLHLAAWTVFGKENAEDD